MNEALIRDNLREQGFILSYSWREAEKAGMAASVAYRDSGRNVRLLAHVSMDWEV